MPPSPDKSVKEAKPQVPNPPKELMPDIIFESAEDKVAMVQAAFAGINDLEEELLPVMDESSQLDTAGVLAQKDEAAQLAAIEALIKAENLEIDKVEKAIANDNQKLATEVTKLQKNAILKKLVEDPTKAKQVEASVKQELKAD